MIVAQLLFLEAENPEKPISLYINSPGGSVTAGMAIYDTVSVTKSVFRTKSLIFCVGSSDAGKKNKVFEVKCMSNKEETQYIQSPVSTLCNGQACSMGSLLLAAGNTSSNQIN